MKQKLLLWTVTFLSLLPFASFAQTTTSELVFKNPVLVSGNDKRIGATYRFSNVRSGTDALLTIASASENAQLVNNIDVTSTGWDKAFQPEIGKSEHDMNKNETWWVRFNMKFVYSNTTNKRKLDKFYATAIDVDGDNSVIQEFIQMYSPDSVKFRVATELTQKTLLSCGVSSYTNTYCTMGPVKNYTNIDTAATAVMATYTFLNTDEINFVYGAKVGNGTTTAGLRLNSLWFKTFDLNINKTLPVKNTSFLLNTDKRNVTLQWSVASGSSVKTFVVEKSSDGINYQSVQTITASDGQANYAYTDASVSSTTGILYYRLLFREVDGEASYSVVRQARLAKETIASLSVYPNPVRSEANLTLPSEWQNKQVTLSVFNASGVQVRSMVVSKASQTETLSFSTAAKGMYVIKAQCNDQSLEQRIIKD